MTSIDQCMKTLWRITVVILLFIQTTLIQSVAHADELAGIMNVGKKAQEPVLVIIGASYAKDWDIRYIGKYRVINKGVGGDETHQMRARFDADVIKQRPSAVLIWGFINDIFRSPREGIADKKVRIRANIEAMITRAKTAGIKPTVATEVFITSPDHMSEKFLGWLGRIRGKQSYQDYVNTHVRDMNAWIREIARQKNLGILDFERVLASENGERQRRYAADDGSHLSTEAYAALTDYTNRSIGQLQ